MKLEAEVIGSAAKFSVNWQRQFLTKYGEPFAIEPSKQEKDRLWPNRQLRSLFLLFSDDATQEQRAPARHAGAFRAIMQKHNRRLYRIARSILRNDAGRRRCCPGCLRLREPCELLRRGDAGDVAVPHYLIEVS
jgi:hypothetical protein